MFRKYIYYITKTFCSTKNKQGRTVTKKNNNYSTSCNRIQYKKYTLSKSNSKDKSLMRVQGYINTCELEELLWQQINNIKIHRSILFLFSVIFIKRITCPYLNGIYSVKQKLVQYSKNESFQERKKDIITPSIIFQ